MPQEGNRMGCGTCGQSLPPAETFWEMVLELEPPSQNKVASNKGAGRHQYREIRNRYELMFKLQRNRLKIPRAKGRRRVFIKRLYSGRGQERDHGNIIGGCKPLLDAMTLAGLLVDDKREFVEDHYSQEKVKDLSGVYIRIEEME